MDITGQIIAYEDGELHIGDIIELFQELIDSGMINQLQGSYGRTAAQLISEGHCTVREFKPKKDI